MRADIAPAALGKGLANLFILDKQGNSARFRLAGTWLGTAFGREPTGTDFAALFDRDDATLVNQLVATVADQHVVALAELHGQAGHGRTIDMEMIILPVADTPARLLGAIHPLHVPFWLGAEAVEPPSLTSLRILDLEKELFSLANRPSIELPQHRSAPTFGRRRNLRVIDGNPSITRDGHDSPAGQAHGLRIMDGGLDPAAN